MLACQSRVELTDVDELGFVPVADVAAALHFQVIAERAGRAAIIGATNPPSESGRRSSPMHVLCKAVHDRLTDPVHIIQSASESHRVRRRPRRKLRLKPRGSAPLCFCFALRSSRTEHPLKHQRPRDSQSKPAEVPRPSCQTRTDNINRCHYLEVRRRRIQVCDFVLQWPRARPR
jgi:IstB-like ATP binding protein